MNYIKAKLQPTILQFSAAKPFEMSKTEKYNAISYSRKLKFNFSQFYKKKSLSKKSLSRLLKGVNYYALCKLLH